jgi:transcriptional regulator with XRE-family HTH domain
VPGLRKEELAVLAGMSPDHYSRLEQGRQPNVSDDVVEALARALQLDDVEITHLRNLAVPTVARRRAAAAAVPRSADPGMLRVLSSLDHIPALLLGRRLEVLACNGLFREVLGWSAAPGSSFARWLFLEPTARDRITNWADFAASTIGALRYEAGRHPDDRGLDGLIGELRRQDPDAARWWEDQRVTFRASQTKRIAHPVAGPLEFGIESLAGLGDPEQRLVVYTVEPASLTARVLPMLASWATADASL